ncbi:hypothetical protein BD324DRAFT_628117 [Kockovaella imperatae]|uniref:Zn(2)-C6 fungal-type domain-containing protein n=1 Tax=Kockovaella imperatae TaxID=4999 RepID=A0A1Y1UE01_9TREE|nr:hypothetical protein BD324DRAFT_628117 [Kockovaella imperatae]ORX36270.1 hypothetical protein BD324DRAFT_628117 [Kockovaella imperatae]
MTQGLGTPAESPGAGSSRWTVRARQKRPPGNKSNACDRCRTAKLRCIDKENPPCGRCRSFGLDCTFGEQSKDDAPRSLKRRLTELEDQIRALDRSVPQDLPAPSSAQDTTPLRPTVRQRPSFGHVAIPDRAASPVVNTVVDSRRPTQVPNRASISSPVRSMAIQDPSPGNYSTPEKDSPIPTDQRFMDHLRDPLFAAAVGQPSRLNVPESPKTHSNAALPPAGSSDVGTILPRMQDAIELGLCTTQEAERLYRSFFDKSHLFLPIFDPITDTFASLRRRSFMSFNSIILVASMAEDTGKDPSSLSSRLLEQIGLAIIGVLLNPVRQIETLQALTLLAYWIDSGWKIGALAVSIGMDLEVHSCLSWLNRRNMARGKKLDQVEPERQAVVGARLWLALFKLRYEYAFNLGRPLASDADELLSVGRQFVDHPLANLGDCRLVASCEFLRARLGLFRPYGTRDARSDVEIEDTIRDALTEIGSLLEHWHAYYATCGVAELHTVRGLLVSEHAHAVLHTAAGSLSVARFDEEILSLPEEKLGWLRLALLAAQQLVHQCLRQPLGQLYAYWTHEQRVGMFFAAAYLVRLSKILPDGGSHDQIARDTEELAIKTSTGPGRALGTILHKVLSQARNTSDISPAAQLPSIFDQNPGPAYNRSVSSQVAHPPSGETQETNGNIQGAAEDPIMWFDDLSSLLVSHDPALASAFTTHPKDILTYAEGTPPNWNTTPYDPFVNFVAEERG